MVPGLGQGREGAADLAGTAAADLSRLRPESGLQRPHTGAAALAPGPGGEGERELRGPRGPKGQRGEWGVRPPRAIGWRSGGYVRVHRAKGPL